MLTVDQLSYSRNNRVLFKQVTFQLLPSQVLHIIGDNGSVKTTLLQILTGLRIPLTGKVMWKGIPIDKKNSNFTENLLYINHHLGMKASLTPIENLYLFLVRRNVVHTQPKKEVINGIYQILEQLNLKDCSENILARLSMGQQRRLSLAKLLLIQADCWILDEPFTSLDNVGIAFMLSLMEKQSIRGGSIVFTSHLANFSLSLEIKKIFLGSNNHVKT